jgi:hypothetical protein
VRERRALDASRPLRLAYGCESSGQAEKFFLKKEPKTFANALAVLGPRQLGRRKQRQKFFVSFFKKENLPSCLRVGPHVDSACAA